ncbi:Protein CBG24452 [Caenorhabditis briggsae]|uniref:Protein CBG24452 n=1 Tax=Caenorhabditis briggsae TaxID=6238 RepID=A8WKR0_CAEBR|nr:Protein CBG24452 [Caenorhabditis briggsae]CAP21055.1 Protein CBG24452 [Caenorhabditis briggsae]
MVTNSQNQPVRKLEEKCRRTEGKSQCRRGVPKPRVVPVVVTLPSKLAAPSPAPTPSPSASSTHPNYRSPNRKRALSLIFEKITEKEGGAPAVAKSTLRQKKHSVSTEAKTPSENDGRSGSKNDKKKKSSTSSDADNKSEGSKEPSENDEKTKSINKDLAKNFFKHMLESQKTKKRCDDAAGF